MRRMGRRIRRLTARVLDLPEDVVLDLPRITMVGPFQVMIENHRGVIHCSERLLRLALNQGELEIQGENLIIRRIMTEEVFLEGTIHSLKFVK